MEVISSNSTYASGTKRLLAVIIDEFLLHAIFSFIFFRWYGSHFDWDVDNMNFGPVHLGLQFLGYNIIKEAVTVLYYSYMESSKYQGTLGKVALGIKVVDARGNGINFSRALLRNLSKYLSALILYIGYIMIIFDNRKQGLHDKIADTFVVNQ